MSILCKILPLLVLAHASSLAALRVQSKPVPVRLDHAGEKWQLVRAGAPYNIKGAGGSGPLSSLKAAGGNSLRTWHVDNLGPVLDEAQRLGLTVAVGVWLDHERHGFRYDDPAQVADQAERVRQAVLKYKDHPAILLWGIGNEMEGDGSNKAIWSAVNSLAATVKKLDPNHPTMTVIAELGGEKVKNLHLLCPEIDIVGINSYAGATSIARRYRDAGGTKPYILTEFGTPGTWETGKTPWGAILEPNSTEKAHSYRRAWNLGVVDQPLCLGGYAFIWGHKQEGTATWFGMSLPDGARLAAVDAMTELWSGKPPANRCPVIRKLIRSGPLQDEPGAALTVGVDTSDPEGDPLQYRWELLEEAGKYNTGGDAEEPLPAHPEAIVRASGHAVAIRFPRKPGGYRLFVYVKDGKGGAATANVPLLVKPRESGAGKTPRKDP